MESGEIVTVEKLACDHMIAHAAATHPRECCGLLLGERAHITAALPTTNIHPKPQTHFEIDPAALIAAHRSARDNGSLVLGYYHSHPTGPAVPSATDQAEATADGHIWAIIDADGAIGWWRDEPSGFTELSPRVIPR